LLENLSIYMRSTCVFNGWYNNSVH